ncbi:hypothetical protein [Mesorhizobium sp. M1272]|uniref:hypothetical protein n=1 Tax=Mesorhizobium sp. M1272 TaxID=2957074 RepID=UPI00333826AF
MGQLTTSTNPAATQANKYDGFGKVARQDVTIGTLAHTTTSVRDASGQTLRTQYLPVPLDFGTLAPRCNTPPATSCSRLQASSPRPSTRPTARPRRSPMRMG